MIRKGFVAFATCAFVLSAGLAGAGVTAEQKCLSGRTKALGKFQACVNGAMAKGYAEGAIDSAAIEKCIDKLDGTWEKLSKLEGSASCYNVSRFEDHAGKTFTDHLTGLVWEQKTAADGNPNIGDSTDVDNGYNADFGGTENGDLSTSFLDGLDGLDEPKSWRIPTLIEMLTIAKSTIPGQAQGAPYWTTTWNSLEGGSNWAVRRNLSGGILQSAPRWSAQYARAVRGGF